MKRANSGMVITNPQEKRRALIKISGDLVNHSIWETKMEQLFDLAYDQVVLIHGAGGQISSAMKKAKVQFKFIKGRRITSYAGWQFAQDISCKIGDRLRISIGMACYYDHVKVVSAHMVNGDDLFLGEWLTGKYDVGIVYTKSKRKKRFPKGVMVVRV